MKSHKMHHRSYSPLFSLAGASLLMAGLSACAGMEATEAPQGNQQVLVGSVADPVATPVVAPQTGAEDQDGLAQSRLGSKPTKQRSANIDNDVGTVATQSTIHISSLDQINLPPFKDTGTRIAPLVADIRAGFDLAIASHRKTAGDFGKVQSDLFQDANTYRHLKSRLKGKLQATTTPGNPIAVDMWQQTDRQLQMLDHYAVMLDDISRESSDIKRTIRAIEKQAQGVLLLSGAVEEDHRQINMILKTLEIADIRIGQLLKVAAAEVSRQQTFIMSERADMRTLAIAVRNGQYFGQSLNNMITTQLTDDVKPARSVMPDDRPLMIIRFADKDVDYAQQLYGAMSAALERRGNVNFDLVAVAPSVKDSVSQALLRDTAKRAGRDVMDSMIEMGMPANHIRTSSAVSAKAKSPQVHIYIY